MALKGKEWFFKQCLREVQNYTPFAHLAWGLLSQGVGQKEGTRGHVTQPIGAVQVFLKRFPHFRTEITKADRTRPFDLAAHHAMLADWQQWFADERQRLAHKQGKYGRDEFGYDIETLATYLTPRFGGIPASGGKGLDEFKKVLRLIPEFWDRK
jgi:hypothetical protein